MPSNYRCVKRFQPKTEELESRRLLSVSRGAFVPDSSDTRVFQAFDQQEEINVAANEVVHATPETEEPVVFDIISVGSITELEPLGSLAYEQTVTGQIDSAGAVETSTLAIQAGQSIAVLANSASSLQVDVTLKDPIGTVIGQTTATSAGDSVFIQSFITTLSGNYTIEFRGASGSTGDFDAKVYINSAIEEEAITGTNNDSIASAQNLDAAFVTVDALNHERAFVIGTRGDDLEEDFESGSLNGEWQTFSNTAAGRVFVSQEAPAGDGEYFLLMDQLQSTGGVVVGPTLNEAIWTVDLSGVSSATLNFSHANFSDEGNSLAQTFTGSSLGDGVSVSQDGTTWHRILNNQQTPHGVWNPFSLDLVAFASSVGISLDSDFHIKFQQIDNSTFPFDGRGYDDISIVTTPSSSVEDWYSLSLNDGESLTLAAKEYGFKRGTTLELRDAGGSLLAKGEPADNSESTILNFVDQTSNSVADTYFIKVVDQTQNYGLLATRTTSYDLERNNEISTAQDISGINSVLGHVAETSGSSLTLIDTFPGPAFSGLVPPDPIVATGPEQIVAAVNSTFAIYDKATGQPLFEQNMNGGPGSFFETVGGTSIAFDPWIVYDVTSERFFFVAIDIQSNSVSNLYIAVSTNSTPTSGADWHKYKIDFTHNPQPLGLGTGPHFPDYEKIAVTADAVWISGNYFAIDAGTGVYSGITAFDKASLLSGLPANIVYQEFIDSAFSVFPLDQRGVGNVQYFVEARQPNIMRIHAVTDVLTSPVRQTHDLVVPTFEDAVNVPQLGGGPPVEAALDARVVTGVWRDGSAWFAHQIVDPAVGDGETVARWYEVSTNTFPALNPTLVQSGIVDPGTNLHTFYPAIAVDGLGNMGIGFSLGGPNIFVGAGYTGRLASDPAGSTIAPVHTLIDGQATYNIAGNGRNRWGDYSGMSIDPTDDKTFWVFNLYASAAGTWSTQFGAFQLLEAPDVDVYSFTANFGDFVTIETSTPFDGTSATTNMPDLEIELFDSSGTSIKSDQDSALDGRNAWLTHAPSGNETFYIEVRTTSGDGSYVLNITGSTGMNSLPTVVSSVPADLANIDEFPQTVTFNMSETIQAGSVQPSDLTGDLIATAVSVQGSKIVFTIDPASNAGDGSYTISLNSGSVADLQGNGLASSYSATFELDTVGIMIQSTTWNGGPMPVDRVFDPGGINFVAVLSEDPLLLSSGRRGPLTPGTDDVVLTDQNSGETFSESAINYDEPTNTFSASYDTLVEGEYELRLISGPGAFVDKAGNGLDGELNSGTPDGTPTGNGVPGGDYAITFLVDKPAPVAANAFVRVGHINSAVSRSADNQGYLHGNTDTDSLTFFAQAGETIAVGAEFDRPVVSTFSLGGVGSSTAASASSSGFLQAVQILADGFYQLDISADRAAFFDATIYRNAMLELASGDSSDASPLPIDGSRIVMESDRFSVVGNTRTGFKFVELNDPGLFFDISPTGIEGVPIELGDDLESVITTTIGNRAFAAGEVTIGDNGGILTGQTNLIFQNLTMDFGSFVFGDESVLVPFWDDLSPPTLNIGGTDKMVAFAGETTIDGIPALIVQWEQFTHFSFIDPSVHMPPPTNPPNITFQVQVFGEGYRLARYSYKDVNFEDGTGPFDRAGNATIGFYNSDGRFLQHSFNTPVLENGDVIELHVDADVDVYEIDLSSKVGNTIEIGLRSLDGLDLSAEVLEIYDEGDNLLATGIPNFPGGTATNFDLAILDFEVPNIGSNVYTIKVSARDDGEYELAVVDSMKLETEPNESGNPLRTLDGGTDRVLGYLDGDVSDRVQLISQGGQPIHLQTATPWYDPQSDPLVDLDPQINLFAGDGTTLLASNSDSAPDGRNADLMYTPANAGTFIVEVIPQSGSGEYVLTAETVPFDFGDAPAPLPTLLADNGARHIATGPKLGMIRDSEHDGQPTVLADGDDVTGSDDEDATTLPTIDIGQAKAQITVQVTDATNSLLNAWIDFNRNNAWEPSEQIADDLAATEGANVLTFNVPPSAVAGTAAVRLRVSTQPGLDVAGLASDGE
ncbi:MAG: Ig-like domain-containing protein, partial [Planctomycetales bacterium]|nr:Ig-like domain-containing protein [Planctomycetales bacterium]